MSFHPLDSKGALHLGFGVYSSRKGFRVLGLY